MAKRQHTLGARLMRSHHLRRCEAEGQRRQRVVQVRAAVRVQALHLPLQQPLVCDPSKCELTICAS